MIVKRNLQKLSSLILSLILAFSAAQSGITAFAQGGDLLYVNGGIIAFEPLPYYVAQQVVPYASELADVMLPDTLMATVRFELPADTDSGGFEDLPPIETEDATPVTPEIIPEEPHYQPKPLEADIPVNVTWQSTPAFNGYKPGEYILTATVTDVGFIVLAEPPIIIVTVMDAPAAYAGIMPLAATDVVNLGEYSTVADIQAAIDTALAAYDTVTVTGTFTNTGNDRLNILIPANKTVEWNAAYTFTTGTLAILIEGFVRIGGAGTFNMTGGSIENTGNGAALSIFDSAAAPTLTMTNGTIKVH